MTLVSCDPGQLWPWSAVSVTLAIFVGPILFEMLFIASTVIYLLHYIYETMRESCDIFFFFQATAECNIGTNNPETYITSLKNSNFIQTDI